jgi:hypothetical protein
VCPFEQSFDVILSSTLMFASELGLFPIMMSRWQHLHSATCQIIQHLLGWFQRWPLPIGPGSVEAEARSVDAAGAGGPSGLDR